MSKTKKTVLIILLSVLVIIASICFYAFLSYTITYSPMNSFMTLEGSIIASIVSCIVLIGSILGIVVVARKKKKSIKA